MNESALYLTADELFGVTRRTRPAAQARQLARLKVPYVRRIDGSVLVWRHAIQQPTPQHSSHSGLNWSKQA